MQTNRDVSLHPLNEKQVLVVACDSCGGIGEAPGDAVSFPTADVAALTARVVLMELLATGASLLTMTAAVCNDHAVGDQVLHGIETARKAGNLPPFEVTLSTEKNIPTSQTGIGLTAIGLCDRDQLRIGRTKAGHYLYAVGRPKVGEEVVMDRGEIATLEILIRLLNHPQVVEILPVGSGGIAKEVTCLVEASERSIEWSPASGLDLTKSAGPSTAIVISSISPLDPGAFSPCPLFALGRVL